MWAHLQHRTTTALLLAVALAALSVHVALAASGSWYQNGVTMMANNVLEWPNQTDLKLSGSSSTSGYRPLASLYVDMRPEDRCQNADGSWQAWTTVAFQNRAVSWVYSTGVIAAQGPYQNCVYGHQYNDKSYHVFTDSGLGINQAHMLEQIH